MSHSDLRTESVPVTAEKVDCAEASTWLAAAVTATLIEYRRLVEERQSNNGATDDATNWRAVACWERLRGGA